MGVNGYGAIGKRVADAVTCWTTWCWPAWPIVYDYRIRVAVERGAKVIWSGEFIGLLFLAPARTAFATFFWYRMVERGDMGRLSIFLFLVPVLGLGTATLVFGEKVSLIEMIGIALPWPG